MDLPVAYHDELATAVRLIERPRLAVRLAGMAGEPVQRVLRFLPSVANRQFAKIVERAVMQCLNVAIESLDEAPAAPPSQWIPTVISGVTGGLGGFFGAVALPVELPFTTVVILRSVAEIARSQGENLNAIDSRLACLEVLALGGPRGTGKLDLGYYATRAVLTKVSQDLVSLVIERGTADAASPVVTRVTAELASRFGLAVSERAAASAIPVIGALGGAAVNMIFMDHFHQLAKGHFIVRKLERQYGADAVRLLYNRLTDKSQKTR
jgi:hypothetical protein